MNRSEDPFIALAPATLADDLAGSAPTDGWRPGPPGAAFAVVARLRGFDAQDQPLLAELQACAGEVVAARTTVPLRRSMLGQPVVVVFEGGNPRQPIIVGVLDGGGVEEPLGEPGVTVHADGERHMIEAQREIVLRCGHASITLTRAGKVVIRGSYILSRSTGCNKLKGASIDIN
jgi:hypothetical protein